MSSESGLPHCPADQADRVVQDPTLVPTDGGEPNDPAEGPRDDDAQDQLPQRPNREAIDRSKVPSTHVPDTRAFDL